MLPYYIYFTFFLKNAHYYYISYHPFLPCRMNPEDATNSDEITEFLAATREPNMSDALKKDIFKGFIDITFAAIQPTLPNFTDPYYEPTGALYIPMSANDPYATDSYILMLGRYIWHLRHFQTTWQLPATITILIDCFTLDDDDYIPKPISFISHATRGTRPDEVILYLALPRQHIRNMENIHIHGTPNYWIHAPMEGDVFPKYLTACHQFSSRIAYKAISDDCDCHYTNDLLDIEHVVV